MVLSPSSARVFYSAGYELLSLDIAPCGTDITDIFRMYLRPLLGSGMPDALRLRHYPVAKTLYRR